MQKQVGNESREMDILREYQKVLEIQNTVKEMKKLFDMLINKLDTTGERIYELEGISIGTS